MTLETAIMSRADEIFELLEIWLIGVNLANGSKLRVAKIYVPGKEQPTEFSVGKTFKPVFEIDPFSAGDIKIIIREEFLNKSAVRIQLKALKSRQIGYELKLHTNRFNKKIGK